MYKNISGDRIRLARAMNNPRLTQDDLVAKLQIQGVNISKNILSRIEIGAIYSTDLELIAIDKALKVSATWLLEESDNPKN